METRLFILYANCLTNTVITVIHYTKISGTSTKNTRRKDSSAIYINQQCIRTIDYLIPSASREHVDANITVSHTKRER